MELLEGSLRRLNTEYVDSLLIHNPPKNHLNKSSNKHYEILDQLKSEGKILEYGASLDTYDEISEFINNTEGKVVEAFFNIIHQDSKKSFKLAKDNGVSIIVKIPLDSGWLSGKYNSDSTFDDVRARWSPDEIKTRAELVDGIKKILDEDQHLSQAAIKFCLSTEGVSTVIPGNKDIGQLKDNLMSINYNLSDKSIKELEDFYENHIQGREIPW